MGELLGNVDGCDLADEDLRCLRDFDACHGSDLICALADDLGVQRAVDQDGLPDLLDLVALKEIASAILELIPDLIVDVGEDRDGLLGSADHAVVECLGMNNGVDCQLDVSRAVDDDRCIARADAEGRLAGRVCRANHARAARSEDAVGILHDGLCEGE